MAEYSAYGLSFRYPDEWSLSDESSDDKVEVTVQSEGTAFWTIAVIDDGPDPQEAVDSAVAAYRDAYPDLDAYPPESRETELGPVVTCEIEFVCLELIASARVTAFCTGRRTVVALQQCADVEADSLGAQLDAVTRSLHVSAADDGPWPEAFLPR